jgi:alkanesulfonate monooxygenase SsuD/methylene tetrahydromethanopterin reductase-like flavin-dependent oxidoreductase (luciferase family)
MEEVLTSSRGGVTPTGKPGELEFYPKEALDLDAVKAFGVIGSPEECAERLAPILELGLAHVYIGTRAVGVDLEEENALRIGRDLLPRLR